MSAISLLQTLNARGVEARVEDGQLKLRPAHLLDTALLQEVRVAKAELLELLSPPTTLSEHSFYPRFAYDPDAARAYAVGLPPGPARDYLLSCAASSQSKISHEQISLK